MEGWMALRGQGASGPASSGDDSFLCVLPSVLSPELRSDKFPEAQDDFLQE
jgi:hypothetical protein